MEDFPAAHSMDTTWFAIDADGHVAAFETGEAGALPLEVPQDAWEDIDALELLPIHGGLVDPRGYFAQLMRGARLHITSTANEPRVVLMFLTDVEPVRELVVAHQADVLATTTGSCIATTRNDLLERVHELGLCSGCALTWTVPREDRVAARGLYDFSHSSLCENWIAGPYVRLKVPIRPITADELPTMVREHAIGFAGRFADTVEIQPAAHWQSRAHSETWMATDYKTRRSFETGEIVEGDDDA